MKKISFLLPLILLLAFPACNKFYDDIQPANDLPIGAVYKTVTDLESALNGVYNTLQSNGLAGASLLLIPELMGGNGSFTAIGIPETFDLSHRTLRSSNFHATRLWVEAYKAINLSNAILHSLDVVKDVAQKDRIEGEALFIRGFLYFELGRYFGKVWGDNTDENGVPIMTEAVFQKGDLTFPARATLQAVYDQATADLTKAQDLLPASQNYDRANPRAAQALLARMAFQKGEYAQAAILAKDLMDNGGYSLTSTPQEFFQNENNPEVIWSVRFTAADGNFSKVNWFGESRELTSISDGLKTAFESIVTPAQKMAANTAGLSIIDLRSAPGILVSADTSFTNKYEDVGGGADDTPIARLAEFILLRAEALARTGDLPGAIDLLNQIRARSLRVRDANGNEPPDMQHLALFSPADFPDANALIEAIILERRVELCFEGNYFQDMIRLQRDIEGLPYNDCWLRLPIPQREIDVNKNLRQNEPCY